MIVFYFSLDITEINLHLKVTNIAFHQLIRRKNPFKIAFNKHRKLKSVYLNTTLKFEIPAALVFQLQGRQTYNCFYCSTKMEQLIDGIQIKHLY